MCEQFNFNIQKGLSLFPSTVSLACKQRHLLSPKDITPGTFVTVGVVLNHLYALVLS